MKPRPFGRRCGWCGRQLRWWQLNNCRACHLAIEDTIVRSSPFVQQSQWGADPDRWSL